MDPITQRLTTLVQKAGADGKFSFFERRGIKKALSAAIESAPSVAKVDEYCDAVRKEVGSARWGLHDFPSSWTYQRTTKLADARSAELSVDRVLPRIAALSVSPRLKSAIEAIARAGEASGDQQDAVRDAYLADLSQCTTVGAVGELYWSTYDVLKDYRRSGLGHDAWWCTGAHQTMRSKSVERQMALDSSIKLFPYNDAPVRR